ERCFLLQRPYSSHHYGPFPEPLAGASAPGGAVAARRRTPLEATLGYRAAAIGRGGFGARPPYLDLPLSVRVRCLCALVRWRNSWPKQPRNPFENILVRWRRVIGGHRAWIPCAVLSESPAACEPIRLPTACVAADRH